MNKINDLLDDVGFQLENFKHMIFRNDVTWAQVSIERWPLGETKIISGSENYKFFESENLIAFETMIPPFGVFNGHKHKEFDEDNFIMEGVYLDHIGEKKKGEWVSYKAGDWHWVKNPSKTDWLEIIVIFTRNSNKKQKKIDTMDNLSVQRIKTAHPDIREKLLKDYTDANNLLGKGSRLRLTHVHRTNAEQDALFNKRPKVTNARGGQSIHNYGLAFDIVMLYDNDKNGTFEEASWSQVRDYDKDSIADWKEVTDLFKSRGWEWGGDWKSFKDAPHFQLKKSNGSSYTWRELKALVDSGKTIKDNGVVYPKI